jgi:4-amino-4-deoxy-L-arabinose transferase-like glycosyltransferase
MSYRRPAETLLLVFVVLLALELPGSWLFAPDEARYAEIPREMLASGDFVTPHLNGAHYFEKPPLLYWLNAGSIALLGHTPYAARLPTRLATLGTALVLLAGLGSSVAPGLGLWAALIYLSAVLGFWLGRMNLTDGLLTFTLTLAFFCMRSFLRAREEGRGGGRYLAGLGLATGLALLTKGLIGIVFPGGVLVLWAAILGKWRRVGEAIVSPAPLVFLAVTVPWFVLTERANPGFAQIFFVREHLLRYATPEASRPGPIYYFVVTFVLGFLPWTVLAARAFGPLATFRREQLARHADQLFFALWFVLVIAFFSLSHSKLIPYILPAFPAAAALTAYAVVRAERLRSPVLAHALLASVALPAGLVYGMHSGDVGRYGAGWLGVFALAAVLAGAWAAVILERRNVRQALVAIAAGWAGFHGAAVVALPRVAEDLSGHDLAAVVARAPGARVVAYRCYPQVLPWELERPIVVAAYRGELGSDGRYPPDLFWTREEFWRRWRSDTALVAVVRRADRREFDAPPARTSTVLGEDRQYVVLSNAAPPLPAPAGARRP